MRIIIVGAGVAGLSAGIYARKQGWDTVIYEKNAVAGGECVSWKRKGYHIDNCVHWMTGTASNKEVYQTWCDCGVLGQGREVIQNEALFSVFSGDKRIDVCRDVEQFRRQLLEISPEDKIEIEWMVKAIKKYIGFDMPGIRPFELLSFTEKIKLIFSMLPLGMVYGNLSKMSIRDYSLRFSSPVIRDFITAYLPDKYNASSLFFVLGTFMSGNCDLPKGGSDSITHRMLDTYLSLGGEIKYNTSVSGVEVEGKRIKGVTFEKGGSDVADYVICACDASVTFDKILGGQYTDIFFKSRFEAQREYPVYSSVNVYLAVDGELPDNMGDTVWFRSEAFKAGASERDSFLLKSFGTEPGYSPEGKNLLQALIVQYGDDFDCWKNLYETDRDAYKAHKQEVCAAVIAGVESKYPQLVGKLSVVECVTPMSFYRWCGAYKGAYMSFILTPYVPKRVHDGRIKGLDNLYLAGQWLAPPGGLPNALVSGRFTVSRIAKDLKK